MATESISPATRAHDRSGFVPSYDIQASDERVRDQGKAGRAEPGAKSPTGEPLDEEEQKHVKELKKTDHEVRQHEQAHMAAGGQHVRGGVSYEYTKGPDGKKYAVGGEVSIDASPVKGDPAATIRKMQQVRSAALAPANPSSQDRSVASQAAKTATEATAELAKQRMVTGGEESTDGTKNTEKSALKNYTNTASRESIFTSDSFSLDLIA